MQQVHHRILANSRAKTAHCCGPPRAIAPSGTRPPAPAPPRPTPPAITRSAAVRVAPTQLASLAGWRSPGRRLLSRSSSRGPGIGVPSGRRSVVHHEHVVPGPGQGFAPRVRGVLEIVGRQRRNAPAVQHEDGLAVRGRTGRRAVVLPHEELDLLARRCGDGLGVRDRMVGRRDGHGRAPCRRDRDGGPSAAQQSVRRLPRATAEPPSSARRPGMKPEADRGSECGCGWPRPWWPPERCADAAGRRPGGRLLTSGDALPELTDGQPKWCVMRPLDMVNGTGVSASSSAGAVSGSSA